MKKFTQTIPAAGWPFLLAALLVLFSCRRQSSTNPLITPESTVLYFNSFEQKSDTSGWYGYGSIRIVDSSYAPGAGHALSVSGGCIIPHAELVLSQYPFSGRIRVSFFGRSLVGSGSLSLRGHGGRDVLTIPVTEKSWSYYSSDSITVTAGQSDTLSIISGGIIFCETLFDDIRIELNEEE